MQPIEGFTPDMLWTFCQVTVGLAALVILGYKLVEIARKERDRKQLKERGPQNAIAGEISKKVLEKLEPRFQEIDRKLNNDKVRLDEHAQRLAALGSRNDVLEAGQKAMCRGVLALLSHEINGNSTDKLRDAQTDINNFLIDK